MGQAPICVKNLLDGRAKDIFDERDRKLEAARQRRKEKRHAQRQAALDGQPDNVTMSSETVVP